MIIKNYESEVFPLMKFFNFINCAKAHLEGDESSMSIFDKLGIDSEFLMANWYKIVIAIVAAGCVCGLIVSNVLYFKRKK